MNYQVTEAPADLAVIDVESLQRWEYTDPKKALDSNVEEEAKKLKNYWYRVRARVRNVGSSDFEGKRKIQIMATPSSESENGQVVLGNIRQICNQVGVDKLQRNANVA